MRFIEPFCAVFDRHWLDNRRFLIWCQWWVIATFTTRILTNAGQTDLFRPAFELEDTFANLCVRRGTSSNPPPPPFVENVLHYPALHDSSSVFLVNSRGRQGAQALVDADIAWLRVDEPQRAKTDSDEALGKLRFQGRLAMRAITGLPSCVGLRTQCAVNMTTTVSLFSFFDGIVHILFAPTEFRSGHHHCGLVLHSPSSKSPSPA